MRWTGQVQAPVTGNYTFSTVTDDGVRLWINGVLLIDAWTDQAAKTNTAAPIALVAGAKYSVRDGVLRTFQRRGGKAAMGLPGPEARR